jgi:hypothetical protein
VTLSSEWWLPSNFPHIPRAVASPLGSTRWPSWACYCFPQAQNIVCSRLSIGRRLRLLQISKHRTRDAVVHPPNP